MAKPEKIWTVINIIKWGTEFFIQKNIDSPRLVIELLLCEVLKIDRLGIYTNFDKPLKSSELDLLHSMVSRRAKHEPLEYIINKTNFMGNVLYVDSSVIIPRPETELLVEEAMKHINNSESIIGDFCTGSGCIAIVLAKNFPNSKIISIDSSGDVINIARKNAILHSLNNIDFYVMDLLKENKLDFKFDIIISNPPYIELNEYLKLQPEILQYEPRFALTDESDGLTFYKRFAEIFKTFLNNKGQFFLEIGFGQAKAVKNIFEKSGYEISIMNDLSGIPRIVHGQIK
ncbi:MAG: peptide chain release factor N(5)-glutamine methyltransferase [FCB group bacterium]